MPRGKDSLGLALMAMMYAHPSGIKSYNPPDADDKIIKPPQSEESKQYYIKRAEEKRNRKRGLNANP